MAWYQMNDMSCWNVKYYFVHYIIIIDCPAIQFRNAIKAVHSFLIFADNGWFGVIILVRSQLFIFMLKLNTTPMN